MRDFVFASHTSRVIFAPASISRLPDEVRAIGGRRALVLSTPRQRELALMTSEILGAASAGVFDGAQMHVPIEGARCARRRAHEVDADCIVDVGGGSTIGLGKAIARESSFPVLAVPTTYAGSEMTPIYGITEAGVKKTGRDLRVLPRTVIYDPALSQDLPFSLSVTSGINAMAHAAEGLYAKDGNPIVTLMAEEGLRAMASALRGLARDPRDITLRSRGMYGAWLCGMVLGLVGMALHHKLCHTLGGSCNLPHAETHAVLLAHSLAYNASAAPDAMARIAQAIGSKHAAAGMYDLALELGAPGSLQGIGMQWTDIRRASQLAAADPYLNPRPVEAGDLQGLLDNAWAGRRPE